MSMKNSKDTIEPVTFRLVAQYLNLLRHRATILTGKMKRYGGEGGNFLPQNFTKNHSYYAWHE
jgi:hypothetical protein